MRHNGQRSAIPFVRLATLAMHKLSLHVEGGDVPVIADDVKTIIGNLTPEQFQKTWPAVFTKIGDGAVTAFKGTLPKPPEKYELKLPEGSLLPATVLERIPTAAREMGITSNEHAQRLIDLMDGESKELAQRIAADYSPGGGVFERQRTQFTEAALKAPDLGNGSPEVLQAKVARVTALATKYFPDDIRKLINDTSVGNHPGFFRAMLKIADLMREDNFVAGAVGVPRKSSAERIYGADVKK